MAKGFAVCFGPVICGVKKYPHAMAIFDRTDEADDLAMRMRGNGQQYQVREVVIKFKPVKVKTASIKVNIPEVNL